MNTIALLTGANGMDAKTLTHFLLRKNNYTVILTYRRSTSLDLNKIKVLYTKDLIDNPNSRLDFIFMDITDQSSIKYAIKNILENDKEDKIGECYSLASQSHVGHSFEKPLYTMQATGIAMFYILEAIKDLTPKTKVFQASTSEMFGGDPSKCPFNEESEFELRSPYAVAKNVAYDWAKYFRQTHDMFVSSAFCFNHSNFYRHDSFYISKCAVAATKIALGKQKELILGNLDFARDESFSDYCCEAFWKMLQLNEPQDFVIGRGRAFTGIEVLELIFNCYNLNWQDYVKQDKKLFRENEVAKLVADSTKAQNILGFKPERMSIKDHIRLMCEYNYSSEINQEFNYPDVFKLFP